MKNWFLFFIMVVFMYLYSYILGGETSMVMVYMFLFSPMVSVLLIIPFRKKIGVRVDMPPFEVEKGGSIRINVNLENKSFMPLPFVCIEFCKAVNFNVPDSYNIVVSLGPYEKKVVSMEYTAISRGVGEIGVKDIWLKDYINLFRLSILKNSEEDRVTGEVTVLPRLINLKPTSKILLGTSESIKQDDSETTTANLFTWNGEPGYEFREYIPGDPLHKIHWKLSAKNETLMVRKDEGRGISKKRLILDPYIKPAQKKKNNTIYQLIFGTNPIHTEENSDNLKYDILALEEKTLEAILAVANTAVKTGREVELWLFEKGKWNSYGIKESKAINEIQYRLAAYKFENSPISDFLKRLPLKEVVEDEGKNRYFKSLESVVFTGCFDNVLYKAVEGFAGYGVIADIVLVDGNHSDNPSTSDGNFAHGKGSCWILGVDKDISEVLS